MAAATEVDYLVIGAGLAGLAFTDALIDHSDANVLIVDRRHGPGGHWNDAYPFVRLHQPSAFYGVSSMNLGDDRIDTTGPNAGFFERATAAEMCHYFQAVLADRLLPSGQVEFLPMTNCVEGGRAAASSCASQLTSAERQGDRPTEDRRRPVPRELDPGHPHPQLRGGRQRARHPGNGLVDAGPPAAGYAVIGAGKTAMDACVWLLEQGVATTRSPG